jgi:L-ascorbate metabolism protein UlaG (beta-lactamase superfamily)
MIIMQAPKNRYTDSHVGATTLEWVSILIGGVFHREGVTLYFYGDSRTFYHFAIALMLLPVKLAKNRLNDKLRFYDQ